MTCRRCYWSRKPICQLPYPLSPWQSVDTQTGIGSEASLRPLDETKPSDMTGAGCFVFDKMRALSSSSSRNKLSSCRSFCFSQKDRPSLLNWEDELGTDSRRKQWSFHNDAELGFTCRDNSSYSRRAYPKSCILAHGRLGTALNGKPSRFTTVFRPLPVCLLTPSPSSMRFLIA